MLVALLSNNSGKGQTDRDSNLITGRIDHININKVMKRIVTEIVFYEFDSKDELGDSEAELIDHAIAAAKRSYSPYSGFPVGSAALLDDGTVVTGCNVENSSFPGGICAEHNALSSVVALYPRSTVAAIAVVALSKEGNLTANPVKPCGKCRQVIAEEEMRSGNRIKIIMGGSEKTVVCDGAGSLLPMAFQA